jgi:DNA-binding NarL/FixJ family response regulator
MDSRPLIHIAYADDHPSVRKGIIMLINSFGEFKVDIEASNGRELIDKIQAAEIKPDICILDINMPEMDGFATLGEIKKRWPDMRVLVLTVFDTEIYIIRMISYGANGYVLKSCEPAELKKALLHIYSIGIYNSDIVANIAFDAIHSKKVKLPNFTDKEISVMKYSCSDLSYAQIAEKMNTTAKSVEGYRDSLFKKLNINSRASLVMFAIRFGIVPLEVNKPQQ